jgi:hypothetical protein
MLCVVFFFPFPFLSESRVRLGQHCSDAPGPVPVQPAHAHRPGGPGRRAQTVAEAPIKPGIKPGLTVRFAEPAAKPEGTDSVPLSGRPNGQLDSEVRVKF